MAPITSFGRRRPQVKFKVRLHKSSYEVWIKKGGKFDT